MVGFLQNTVSQHPSLAPEGEVWAFYTFSAILDVHAVQLSYMRYHTIHDRASKTSTPIKQNSQMSLINLLTWIKYVKYILIKKNE